MGCRSLFEFVGVLTIIGILSLCLVLIITYLQSLILDKINEYKIKHRFDKPPTAKCYCKDCAYHGILVPNGCECPGRRNYYSPDDGFCHEAKPKSRFKNKI